tara:strand:- start:1 stop:810 length:810 start_codon:yes stop_codon:yes gene_type:complete
VSNPIKTAQETVDVIKDVMSLAGETPELKDAGSNLAKSAKTITGLVNNCLMPIAAVNFAFDKGRQYFDERFSDDLQDATKTIPEDNLVEPKASIAAPVLEGLGFSHEEQSLKDLYLKLLSSAMDGRSPSLAHPSFAEIIKQLSADEAGLIGLLFKSAIRSFPIVTLNEKADPDRGYRTRYKHLFFLNDSSSGDPVEIDNFPAMLDNWQRLGLIEIDYLSQLTGENEYDCVEKRPEYLRLKAEIGLDKLVVKKGVLEKTAFGENFAKAVI